MRVLPLLTALTLAGCAVPKTNVVPLSANEVQVLVDAPPRCGPTGAQQVALDRAAIAVVRRGFDHFVVLSINGISPASGVVTSSTTTTAVSSGSANIVRRHQNTVRIRMYRTGEAEAGNAINARTHLGEKWQVRVKEGVARAC